MIKAVTKNVQPFQPPWGQAGSSALHTLAQESVDGLFAACAASHGERIAAVCGDRSVSYSELDELSQAIGEQLLAAGCGHGDIVAVLAPRSIEAVAAMLGILRAGAAYLPLDPSYPPDLLEFIRADSGSALALVHNDLSETDAARPFLQGPCFRLDADCRLNPASGREPSIYRGGDPQRVREARDLRAAYVMYTSGSTGRPKGVMIPHGGIIRLVSGCSFVDLGPDEVVLQLAPLSFDASTFEIWGALLNGGRLAIVPAVRPALSDIADAVHKNGVTTLWLTAGLFNLMVDKRLDGLKPVRQLVVGGDVLSPAHVAKAQRALPSCRIVNGYGPTENTTFTCCYSVPRGWPESRAIPIGTPINGTTIRILDEDMSPAEEGELHAGGAGLALGYLGRPDLTAERFIDDPFEPGARLYRTGDRVRRRPDGALEFLGRLDRQIKIDGKRVELDEIEAQLRRVAGVRDAAVVCCVDAGGCRSAAAFVDAAEASAQDVRARLRGLLPDYMIPSSIEVLEALPMSPNGKVDRTRLAALLPPSALGAAALPAGRAAGSARDALEAVFRRVLGLAIVPHAENFFDLGASSLKLIQAHADIVESLGVQLAVTDLFAYPNIAVLAAEIGRRKEGRSNQPGADLAARHAAASARVRAAAARRCRA